MELSVLQPLLPLLLLLPFLPFFFHLLFPRDPRRRPFTHGLKSYPLLGYLPDYVRNRHRFLDWTTEILLRSPTLTVSFQGPGGSGGAITANPANVEHMLKTHFDNYPKGALTLSVFHDFLGDGLFNSDGEQWRWQRKAAALEFNKRSFRSFVVDTVRFELAERLFPLLEKAEQEKETLDLQDVLQRFGLDNICKVAFDEDPACLGLAERSTSTAAVDSEFMRAYGEAQNLIMQGRFMSPIKAAWRVKKLFDVGSERRLRQLLAIVRAYADKIVRARRENSAILAGKDDLLSRFASNRGLTQENLRDVVTNFLIAGSETTSSALTWFFWLVSTKPGVAEKVVKEVRSIRDGRGQDSRGGAGFGLDELREMQYLHAAVTESMRLYPPVPFDTRSCGADDFMPDGASVRKGWQVGYCAYAMGRMAELWGEDCGEYRPERWLDEEGAFQPESPFKYPVFHAGPRMCSGKEMAYIQMKSIAACVLERYRVEVVGKEGALRAPEHVLSFTLKMKGGLPVRLRKREE